MYDEQQLIDWEPWRPILAEQQRFVLTSHVRPDCDALGSELALAALLRGLGKEVRIVNADATPPRLKFVDPDQQIEVLGVDVDGSELVDWGVLVVVDTSAWPQLGDMADVIRAMSLPVVVIDHHASDSELPAQVFKNAQAEATGRLIFEMARYFEVPVTAEMAAPLFAAIATDTGWFRFPSTSSATYQVIGELVAAGACPSEIFRQLYECDSMSRTKLRGLVLSRIVTELDGRLTHTHVLAEDFAETGALPSETEDFVNMGLSIDGTEVAVMLTEQPVGTIKASFRSRSAVDCSQMAATFGGGGHKAAAGATLSGPFETVQLRVLDKVRSAMGGKES